MIRKVRTRWVVLGALGTSLAACVTPVGAEPTTATRHAGAVSRAPATLVARAQRDYEWLHSHPELSGLEETTSKYLVERLRSLGFRVRDKIGGFGIVGVLQNGAGKTALLRTELDALPVLEQTDVSFKSLAKAIPLGQTEQVCVMHACGHDVHMASLLAVAEYFASHRNEWRGTLVLVGQPAEETLTGARAMFEARLLDGISKPDLAFAIHNDELIPVGKIGYRAGPYAASADWLHIEVFGKGGHGAYPHLTVDPIVLASKIVLSLQTIVSRENDPLDPVVVTVGKIAGGTKNNIIPDQVSLDLMVRTYSEDVRKKTLAAIERIAVAEAVAANAPKRPTIEITPGTNAVINDPASTEKLRAALEKRFGQENLVEAPRSMGSEDFSEFGKAGIPSVMLAVGAANPDVVAAWKKGGPPPPSSHSGDYLPAKDTLRTAIEVEIEGLLTVLGK